MPPLRNRLSRSLDLPPNLVFRKAAARVANTWRRAVQRRRDQGTSSYDPSPRAVSLARFLGAPDPAVLAPHAATLAALAELYLAHRFDLLGSGWVQVRHGMSCRGLEGHRYPPAPKVTADRDGRWLEGRVNSANLPEARRVWSLVDAGYVPIDWQLDFKSGHRWSETVWFRRVLGTEAPPGADIKVPWELARGLHLPQCALAALARPARTAALAREFRNQILDFVATNPPRWGVNWACAMDVAIRAANWVVARDLFGAAGATFDAGFDGLLARSLREHARHVAENLEWSELRRGNHYLADLCGLLFASSYLPADAETDAWLALGIQEIAREAERQFDRDGANFEASTSYHRLSAEFVIYAVALILGLPATRVDALQGVGPRRFPDGPRLEGPPAVAPDPGGVLRIDLPTALCEGIPRMAEFALRVAHPGGTAPQIGDNDNGRLFRLCGAYDLIAAGDAITRYRELDGFEDLPPEATYPDEQVLDHRPLVAAANALAPRGEFTSFAHGFELETALVRALARGSRVGATTNPATSPCTVVGGLAALDAMLAQIRSLPGGRSQRYEFAHTKPGLLIGLEAFAYPTFGLYILRSPLLYLAIRCGPLDRRTDGAHAHSDQLAIELAIGGEPRIVDPGSFVYTPLPASRNRYRSASAHFAPRIAGLEPTDLSAGLFVLRERTQARCHYFGLRGFAGTHVGFGLPVLRSVTLEDDRVVVEDGSLGEPLERLETAGRLPVSPKYGVRLR